MPRFTPGESKVAIATFPVRPAELACTAELWLGSDSAKVARSGEVPFVSTGADQAVSLPITIPVTEGTYHVYVDVYAEGNLVAAYQAIEDVVVLSAPRAELRQYPRLELSPDGLWIHGIWWGWINRSPYNLQGHLSLTIVTMGGDKFNMVATKNQNAILAPGGEVFVYFPIKGTHPPILYSDGIMPPFFATRQLTAMGLILDERTDSV